MDTILNEKLYLITSSVRLMYCYLLAIYHGAYEFTTTMLPY